MRIRSVDRSGTDSTVIDDGRGLDVEAAFDEAERRTGSARKRSMGSALARDAAFAGIMAAISVVLAAIIWPRTIGVALERTILDAVGTPGVPTVIGAVVAVAVVVGAITSLIRGAR